MNSREKFLEEVRIQEAARILSEKKKKGFLKMEKIDDRMSLAEVLAYQPPKHQFCYSGLHW